MGLEGFEIVQEDGDAERGRLMLATYLEDLQIKLFAVFSSCQGAIQLLRADVLKLRGEPFIAQVSYPELMSIAED